MTTARKKRIHGIIGTVIGIVIVVALALLIFVNSGFLQKNAPAVTVGSHTITPAEFNYYYQDTYYNIYYTYAYYGMWDYMVDTSADIGSQTCYLSDDGGTWKEYIRDTAIDSAVQAYVLYDAGHEEGFEMDEDTQASLDSVVENVETYAEEAGYDDANEYLETYYGKGATLDSYAEYMEVQYYASAYSSYKSDSFSYTTDELRTYYDDNVESFDTVTYRVFSVTTEDDDNTTAKATADAMAAELDGSESSFVSAAYEYADEDSKESYEEDSYTLRSNYSYSSISSDYADWLFSDDREGSESQVFATSSGYAIVMFVSRDRNDYGMANVRHILVSVETSGDDGESTDDDWAACLESIEEIEALWEDTDMTEDDFAELAEEYSDDSSAENGGLIEDIYKNEMVEDFNSWCFDEGRTPGDYGIVETTYGYHLIYYVSTGDEYWTVLADAAIRSEDYSDWYTGTAPATPGAAISSA